MLDLKDLFYFVQVVDRGGFAAAGRLLGVPKSTISHRVQQLEAGLGIRLINRTSRRFGMTEVGQAFYANARATLEHADLAEASIRAHLIEPSGVVRMTTPVALAQFALRDLLPAYLARYPKVRIVQQATDVQVDIVAEGFDLALRGHGDDLPTSTLVQRKLADVPWQLFAGSAYLDERGTPQMPDDLVSHDAIAMGREASASWSLVRHEVEIVIPITPRFVSNDMVVLKDVAAAGLGIVALPAYVCWADVTSGRLRRVLPGWTAARSRVTALLPYRQGLLPAVRTLVDFLAQEFPRAVAPIYATE